MCAECERAYRDKLKTEIDCENCPTVCLMPENAAAWRMIQDADKMLFRPGGIDPAAIELIFRLHRVAPEEEPEAFEKIMAYADEAIAYANEKK